MKKRAIAAAILAAIVMVVGAFMLAPAVMAQDEEHAEDGEASGGGASTGTGLIAIGAGLAVGIAGFGTGTAQAGVGAGGTGAIAEKPELLINVLILFAIPETIVIFGMVIAFMLMGNM